MKTLFRLGALWAVLCVVVPLLVVPLEDAHAQNTVVPDMEFTIAVGETLTLDARGVRRVSIGLPEIADAQTSSDQRFLFISGKSEGVTTINIFAGSGNEQRTLLIRVVGVNPTALAEEVRSVLGDRAGVDIRVVKGRVLIEGEVSSEIFQRKIDRLTELYPNQVLNFATYREAFVEGARMVAIDVYFIQLATTNQDNLGVRWNQFIGMNLTGGSGDVPLFYNASELGPGVLPADSVLPPRPMALTGGSGLTTYSSIVGNLNFALDLLVDSGMIKTIQHATMITEAGTETNYLSGGTLLIPISTDTSIGIAEKEYGLKMKVTPVLDFENRVKLTIEMVYSELDYANGVQGLPALRNNEITSTVNMQEGQSVLVSSQDNVVFTSNERGLWLLSRIPILGWAFKSRSMLNQELNNALFLTPRVYEPGTDYHRTLVQGVFQELLDAGAQAEDLPELTNAQPQGE
ncbi:hypothetical protein DL240_00980 [Lujinxingia litoralis]|uniref:Uncharacterized protein n=1 Tax=Lujinxingia litoralis TaxID=2211119 RepID=A0A328CAV2_9DELT|nr:pilus assembly protein N-terminal domain-containing protein [Lujinxingia litoralis]RAL24816.1 hypothetical protein DL240_00980 [Lujinxingia litoralis]